MKDQQPANIDTISEIDFSRILTNPILDIAARLWGSDRYAAFQVCYRSMRLVDDLVDDARTSERPMSDTKRSDLVDSIRRIVGQMHQGQCDDRSQQQLFDVLKRFQIPLWPWERLARSMLYDLHHEGFASFLSFLRYCEGAAIAPAAVFVHLCRIGLSNDQVSVPPFDVRRVARPLALFSYLIHIMRDFQKDQKVGLNYFSDDLLRKHDLTPSTLRQIAVSGERPPSFRRLMVDYCRIADYYRQRARNVLDRTASLLQPRYRASLELIYELYLQIFERIDPKNGLFTPDELNPSAAEMQARIDLTLVRVKP
jgi:phytoene synthase